MAVPLVPFHEFTIVCNRPKDEVVRILTNHIVGTEESDLPFSGSITSNEFKIKRRTWSLRKFRAVFEGTISYEDKTTSVYVYGQMNRFSLIVMIIFMAFFVAVFILTSLEEGNIDNIGNLLFVFLNLYIIPMLWFAFDVGATKSELVRILRGHIEE